jgi:putative ABC transport system permease protein
MTLAMLMLVVFTLTAMNFIQTAMGAAFGDTQRLSGGFEIRADAGYADPILDMKAALEDAEGIQNADVAAVGEVSNLPAEVKQSSANRDLKSLYVQGVDGATRRASTTTSRLQPRVMAPPAKYGKPCRLRRTRR